MTFQIPSTGGIRTAAQYKLYPRHVKAPQETSMDRAVRIANPPETRGSFGPRAIDGWYVGPAWDHYRSMTFQLPSTGGIRTAAQYKLYPRHVKAPQETPIDRAVRISGTLTNTIKRMLKDPSIDAGRHEKALEQLANIFETATEKLEKDMRTEHIYRPHPQQESTHGGTISTLPKTREGTKRDTNGQSRAHFRNPHQSNKENAKRSK